MQNKVWLEKNKIKHIYPYLSTDISCDIVVIGGGISGAITSYILANEGHDVVVLDKNIIGYKNTANCSGCITDFTDELYVQINKDELKFKIIKDLKSKATDTLKQILSKVKGMCNNSNYLILDTRLFRKKYLKNEILLRKSQYEECDFLPNEEVFNVNNIVEIQKGAYNLNPYLFTQNILDYLSRNFNVRVFENTDVKFIEATLENVNIYTQNNFRITAKNVIITTPIETIDFVTENPNIELVKRYSLVCNNAFKENLYAKVLSDNPFYIRNDKEKVIISGYDTKCTAKMNSKKYAQNINQENKEKFENILLKIFPKYNITQSDIYSSNILKTRDGLPIISELSYFPNVYVNLGSGGNGIMQSIVGANMLKDVVRGYYPKEMSLFDLKRN